MRALLFALFLPLALAGEPVPVGTIVIDGKTYETASVSLTAPNLAQISHASGVRNIHPAFLEETLREAIGYDPEAAQAADREAAAGVARADQEKAMLARLAVIHLHVIENTPDGLIVGHFKNVGGVIASSSARIGGGGAAISYSVPERQYEGNAWIPHTAETRGLANDSEFYAKVLESGTQRISDYDVLKLYKLHAIVPKPKPEPRKKK